MTTINLELSMIGEELKIEETLTIYEDFVAVLEFADEFIKNWEIANA